MYTPVPSHILLRFYGTLSLSVQFLFGFSFVPPQKEEAQAQAQQFSNEGGGPDHGAGAQEVEDHEGGRQQEEPAAQGEQGGGAGLAQGGEVAGQDNGEARRQIGQGVLPQGGDGLVKEGAVSAQQQGDDGAGGGLAEQLHQHADHQDGEKGLSEIDADGGPVIFSHGQADQGHHTLGDALHHHGDHQAQVGDHRENGQAALSQQLGDHVVVQKG